MNIENWNFEEYEKEKKEFEKLKQIERLQREKEANMDTYFVEYSGKTSIKSLLGTCQETCPVGRSIYRIGHSGSSLIPML